MYIHRRCIETQSQSGAKTIRFGKIPELQRKKGLDFENLQSSIDYLTIFSADLGIPKNSGKLRKLWSSVNYFHSADSESESPLHSLDINKK